MLIPQGWEKSCLTPSGLRVVLIIRGMLLIVQMSQISPQVAPQDCLEVAQRAIKRLMKLRSRALGNLHWLCICLLPAGGFS